MQSTTKIRSHQGTTPPSTITKVMWHIQNRQPVNNKKIASTTISHSIEGEKKCCNLNWFFNCCFVVFEWNLRWIHNLWAILWLRLAFSWRPHSRRMQISLFFVGIFCRFLSLFLLWLLWYTNHEYEADLFGLIQCWARIEMDGGMLTFRCRCNKRIAKE